MAREIIDLSVYEFPIVMKDRYEKFCIRLQSVVSLVRQVIIVDGGNL